MERMGLEPGTQLGGYTIMSQLGSGAMGVVYRAIDDGGQAVAFKILRSDVIDKEELRERLVREAAALRKVKHPAVSAMLDAETESDETFIVTELIEGPTLDSYVADHGPLPADQLLHAARRLAGALGAVHAAGVIHRDMKPNNVLMGHEGPVLIDFGIAHGLEDSRLTATGMVIGTPGYLAPEMVTGSSPSPATDWWGWAAVLVFAATGRPPYGVGGYDVVISRAMAGKADVNGLDRRIAVALRGALAVRPEHRWSVEDVLAELENAALYPNTEGLFYDPVGGDGPTEVLGGVSVPASPYGDYADETHYREQGQFAPAVPVPPPSIVPAQAATMVAPFPDQGVPPTMVAPQVGEAYGIYPPAQFASNFDQGGYGPGGMVPQEPQIYARPKPRPRPIVFGTASLAAIALGITQPMDTLLVVSIVLLVFTLIGTTWDAFHARREFKGQTKHEGLVATFWAPWRLIRAILGTALNLLIALAVALPIGAGLLWGLQINSGDLGQLPNTHYRIILAVVWVAFLLMMWFGPLPRPTREGGRYLINAVVPGPIATGILVALLVIVIAFGVITVMSGAAIEWHLLQEAPRIP